MSPVHKSNRYIQTGSGHRTAGYVGGTGFSAFIFFGRKKSEGAFCVLVSFFVKTDVRKSGILSVQST